MVKWEEIKKETSDQLSPCICIAQKFGKSLMRSRSMYF